MDYGGISASGSGGGSVLKIVNDLAKGSKMPTVNTVQRDWEGGYNLLDQFSMFYIMCLQF